MATYGYVTGAEIERCEVRPFVSENAPAAQRRGPGVENRPVDCAKAFLSEMSAGPICRCNFEGCVTDVSTLSGLYLRQDGDNLVGNFIQAAFMRDGLFYPLGSVTFRRE